MVIERLRDGSRAILRFVALQGDIAICGSCGNRILPGGGNTVELIKESDSPENQIMLSLAEPRTAEELAHDLRIDSAVVIETLRVMNEIGLAESNGEFPKGVWRLVETMTLRECDEAPKCHIELTETEDGFGFGMSFSQNPPDHDTAVYQAGIEIMEMLSELGEDDY